MNRRVPGRKRRTLLWRRDATAAVELAILAPVMLILLAGVVDFGRMYREEIELSSAVAAAAEYALINGSGVTSAGAAGLATTISGIVANSNGAAWANTTVTVNDGATNAIAKGVVTASGTAANANSCWCPTGRPASWNWGVAAACGTPCAGGTLAGKFVSIAGTRTFTAIFTSYGLISNNSLSQSTIVQTQ